MYDLTQKTILITGGTGSFGHKLVDHISGGCKEIRIFSRDELKQELMRKKLDDPRVKFYIGDVRDPSSVDKAMNGVDLVFHAAALKQVPSCEFFPHQAVMTNIMGSNNVIDAAIKHKVGNIVCLGTDKAVYPVNAMGMTKALMEKVANAAAMGLGLNDTIVSRVRYGNVMCSRGSVIPLFIDQIKNNKPITITDPSMTRFLLSLDDAIELVLFAFKNAEQGDLFIRKAPSCTVGDLALALKSLFNSDVPIETIGVRHGEKIHETLATMEELSRSEDMGEYFRIGMDERSLNYNAYFTEGDKMVDCDYTSHSTRRLTIKETEQMLLGLTEIRMELER